MVKAAVKALMVEDLQMAQVVAAQLFSKLNCQLDVVSMATKGLEKTLTCRYDLIFVDIQLPDINGLDFVKALRSTEPNDVHIPIIAVTSTPTEELRNKAKNVGCDNFMQKPLTLNCVSQILSQYLNSGKKYGLNLN